MTDSPEPAKRPPGPPANRAAAPAAGSGPAGPAAQGRPGPGAAGPKRTSAQIREDIENQREQLGQSVDHLRDRVTELTDWRGQLRKHRKKIVVGAVAAGFVAGGLMALRRR
ncbi:MAG: DUF3618 domain-containing protein [Solirubrobacterales bacterium]|nr:DUF3618 domain-containing protein [Solirubrobacterales bacterium]